MPDGVGNGRRPRTDIQFAKDVGDVVVDGATADEERIGDVLTGVAIGEQAEHFQFAR